MGAKYVYIAAGIGNRQWNDLLETTKNISRVVVGDFDDVVVFQNAEEDIHLLPDAQELFQFDMLNPGQGIGFYNSASRGFVLFFNNNQYWEFQMGQELTEVRGKEMLLQKILVDIWNSISFAGPAIAIAGEELDIDHPEAILAGEISPLHPPVHQAIVSENIYAKLKLDGWSRIDGGFHEYKRNYFV